MTPRAWQVAAELLEEAVARALSEGPQQHPTGALRAIVEELIPQLHQRAMRQGAEEQARAGRCGYVPKAIGAHLCKRAIWKKGLCTVHYRRAAFKKSTALGEGDWAELDGLLEPVNP